MRKKKKVRKHPRGRKHSRSTFKNLGLLGDSTLNYRLSQKTIAVLKKLADGYGIKYKERTAKKYLVWQVAGAMLNDPKLNGKPKKPEFGWYVIRTAPGREQKVMRDVKRTAKAKGKDKLLGRMMIVRTRSLEIRAGKRQMLKRKSYPNYILARVRYCDDARLLFEGTKGCLGFLGVHYEVPEGCPKDEGYLTTPNPLTQGQVEKILEEHHKAVKKEEVKVTTQLQPGDRIKVIEGAFKDCIATVRAVIDEGSSNPSVKAETLILGRPVELQLPHWGVKHVKGDV